MSILGAEVNRQAALCCRKATVRERREHFRHLRERRKAGLSAHMKYYAGEVYYKGNRKGQPREVFIIDGHEFEKLWERVLPYVITSATRSDYLGYRDRPMKKMDLIEDIATIREATIWNITYHGIGPMYSQKRKQSYKFAQYFGLLVNNWLSNIAMKRGYPSKYKTHPRVSTIAQRQPLLLFDPIRGNVEFDDQSMRIDTVKGVAPDEMEFFATVPKRDRVMVERLLGGDRISAIAREQRVSSQELRRKVAQLIDPDCIRGTAERLSKNIDRYL